MTEEITKPEKKIKTKKSKPSKAKKPGKYGRFNFLDAIIIICVLAVAALLLFVYSPADLIDIGREDTAIIYTIRISGVPAEYASQIAVGDAITDPNGYKLGVVAADVEVQEHLKYEYNEDEFFSGGIIQVSHPDLTDLIITVSANAEKSPEGYTVDGKRIAVEAEYEIILPRFESKGLCLSLSEEKTVEAGTAK